MESFECDVVIVGAGLSGLSSAYYLVKKDQSLRIVVLEAKDRIGGKTLTRQLTSADGSKDFWDLGGEWIGRPQPHAHYLLKKFDVNRFNPASSASGKGAFKAQKLSWQTQLNLRLFKWKLKRLKNNVGAIDCKNATAAVKWDLIEFQDYIEENLWTSEAKAVVENACHCMFGLTPKEMTLLFFLKNVEIAGGLNVLVKPEEFSGGEFRIKGGTQQLSYHLLNKIGKQHVYLNQPVAKIMQSIEGARVTTSNGKQILCQRVILAVPPHPTSSIHYDPPLSARRVTLLQSIPLAFLVKFVVTFETAFWRKGKGHQQQGFQAVLTDTQLGPIGLLYEAFSGRGNPALAGFVSHADQLDQDPKNRKYLILSLVEQHVGPQCQQYLDFSLLDWSVEPYSGGCFLKDTSPEKSTFFNNELKEPFDRIHFAGTETATVWRGFMNGAIQAGFRAASEVMYHLRPLIPASPYPEKERNEIKSESQTDSQDWLGWLALGAGVASVIFIVSKTKTVSVNSDTFVRNIRLVFDPAR